MKTLIFNVDDYGAVGDGATNDGFAICRAVDAAVKAPKDAKKIIIFACEKEYRITGVPEGNKLNCLFSLNDTDNISIEGKGTKLIFKGTVKLLYITNSRNFNIEGFVIDYSPKPFILAKVSAINSENLTMDFDAEEDVGLSDTPFVPTDWWFAFPNRSDMRYHYFISKYEKTGEKKYRITIHEQFADRVKEAVIGEEFLLPHCGGSHQAGGSCTFMDCENIRAGYLRFYSHPEFGFDIRSNKGKIVFESIALKPRDDAREQLVSWRDCFHVKDNITSVKFNNCYIGPIGDDAFNLSCVHLDVTYVGDDKKTVYAHPAEKGDTREIDVGDEFVAYDLDTGKKIGRGFAEKVIVSKTDVRFVSDVVMPDIKPGMQISFYKFANPGFVVKNSYIEGTVRVRSSGTFENCTFNVFWVRIENEFFVEGPVPRNITFKNCKFTTPYEKDAEIFHVGTLAKHGITDCEYKCKNIVLDNCTFEKGTYHADEGNELIIK